MKQKAFDELIKHQIKMNDDSINQEKIRHMYRALVLACDVLRTGNTDMPIEVIYYDKLENYFIEQATFENLQKKKMR